MGRNINTSQSSSHARERIKTAHTTDGG